MRALHGVISLAPHALLALKRHAFIFDKFHLTDLNQELSWTLTDDVAAGLNADLQVGLRRTIELTEAAIREINLRNLISTALLSRGTLETACLLWDVMNGIEQVVASGDRAEVKRLLKTISKSLLGGKAKEVMLDETVEARNVITIIQRPSKKSDVPLFRFFERLSEYAHPNYHGMMATYTEAGAYCGIKAFCDGRASGERALLLTAIGTVATSCSITVESFKIATERLESFAALAERAVFEAGTWPKDVAYPVRRS